MVARRLTTPAGRAKGSDVFVGMDSHKDTLAVSDVDQAGRQQQTQTFANTRHGHRRLLVWLQGQPGVVRVGIEGAGGYGVRWPCAWSSRTGGG
jgi:transposase